MRPINGMYPACKFALTAMTECIRQELIFKESEIKISTRMGLESPRKRLSWAMQSLGLKNLVGLVLDISTRCLISILTTDAEVGTFFGPLSEGNPFDETFVVHITNLAHLEVGMLCEQRPSNV
uniref:CSON002864 protein n=1 Tax=Culicoides sonorensis TaxID=179676 RepID=A0A336MM09_CULSO